MSEISPEQTFEPSLVTQREPAGAGSFSAIEQLLRDRSALLARIEASDDLAALARTMIITIFFSAAIFGASLGLFRGGVQIAYAGVKLPLVILLTAAFATPTLSALRHVVEGQTDVRRDLALVLCSLALGSLIIAALAPVVLLAISWGVGYHGLVLIVVGCCAVGGAVGLSLFIRGTTNASLGSRALVVGIVFLVVGLVGVQMTWTMRPYVVRPRTEQVPIVRSLEGSFLDSVTTSLRSSMGVYSRERAPLPGSWSVRKGG